MNDICNSGLISGYSGPTYGSSQLDYILLSESLLPKYTVSRELPIDNSKTYHSSLVAAPKVCSEDDRITFSKRVFDLRASNVSRFLEALRTSDFSLIYDREVDLNEKCRLFHNLLDSAFDLTIPSAMVKMTANDKPWMTPTLKLLINKRWNAFRTRNFQQYRHFKEKVKKEILKAKNIWVNKCKKRNIWRLVKTTSGKNRTCALSQICKGYPSVKMAVDAINGFLHGIFQSSDDVRLPAPSQTASFNITEFDVYNHLCGLRKTKASPEISTTLYKSACHILAAPFVSSFY